MRGCRRGAMTMLRWARWSCKSVGVGTSLVSLLALACSSDGGGAPTPKRWDLATARDGLLGGRLVDQDTGAAVAGAVIAIGLDTSAQRATTRQDGSFEARVPAGRTRIFVESTTHVGIARDVVVGEVQVDRTVRVARKGDTRNVSGSGGALDAGEGQVQIPAGAFASAQVAVTYFGKGRLPSLPGSAQFVDDQKAPNRIKAAIDLQVSAGIAQAVQLSVPVAAGTAADALKIYRAAEGGGWIAAGVSASVADGRASFGVLTSGTFAVGLDARKAEGGQTGYVVLDQGDSTALGAGDLLPTGMI